MAILETIWVIHTTSNAKDASTDDSFTLHLPATGKAADSLGHFLPFPNQKHDERERGRTDQYEFSVRKFAVDHVESQRQIKMETKGKNAWLPQSIWVIGRTIDGRDHLLVARPNWPTDRWFSNDSSEGKGSHTL